MSLQGLGYLISSYVAPHHDLHEQELSSSSSVMPGAMGNPHTREQSVFADIESQPQQLFRPAPSTANQVVDRYTPQRPRASPLNVLDFRQACGAPAKQIITV